MLVVVRDKENSLLVYVYLQINTGTNAEI